MSKSYLDIDIFEGNDTGYEPKLAEGTHCNICTKNKYGQKWERDRITHRRLFYRNPDGKGELCGFCVQKYTTMRCVEENRS